MMNVYICITLKIDLLNYIQKWACLHLDKLDMKVCIKDMNNDL